MARASITKTAELVGFSRANISRIMTEFKKHGKTSSNLSNSGLANLLAETDGHYNALWDESIGILPPKWLLS